MTNYKNVFGGLIKVAHPHEIDGDYTLINPTEHDAIKMLEESAETVKWQMPRIRYMPSVPNNRHNRRKQLSIKRKQNKQVSK